MNRAPIVLLVILVGIISPSGTARGQAAPATRPTFDVRAFGAVGDGKTKDTAAFQRALDTCAVNGGGDCLVPPGNYLIGSIQIGNATTIRLAQDATLTGSPDMADYPMMDVRWEGRWEQGHRALIYAGNVNHIGIAGPGHIIGNATLARRAAIRGPVLIEPISCDDVHLDGFSTQNWSLWSTHPTYCTNVILANLTVRNNSDGMDIDSCKHVRIDSCDIDSGDDSISLKSGRGMDGARLAVPCEDVLITHCTLADRTFACIGIGSETSGGVRDVRIEHCKFVHSGTDAIYIKTRIGRAGVIENVTGGDLDIQKGNGGFLRINLISSGNASTPDDTVTGDIGYPVGRNFSFSNVRVDCRSLVDATKISTLKPLDGLSLSNISGTCQSGISLVNVVNANLHDINVTGFTGPLLATENVTGDGLDGAVKYVPPPATGRRGAPGAGTGGDNAGKLRGNNFDVDPAGFQIARSAMPLDPLRMRAAQKSPETTASDAPLAASRPVALALTVLGSGGPGATGRASTGFVLSLDGSPRILIDAGPGTFTRLGETGISLDHLDLILLTHLHIDHTGELPGILLARTVSSSEAIDVQIFGPTGAGPFPSTKRFVDLLFGKEGAFAYLTGFSAPLTIVATDVDARLQSGATPQTLLSQNGLTIKAIAGHHFNAPAIIYRVEYKGRSVVFSGDIDPLGLENLRLIADHCDLLVFNTVVLDPPHSPAILYSLHTPPKKIGGIAAAAHVGALLLTHLNPSIDEAHEEVVGSIRRTYGGPITFARDGMEVTP